MVTDDMRSRIATGLPPSFVSPTDIAFDKKARVKHDVRVTQMKVAECKGE